VQRALRIAAFLVAAFGLISFASGCRTLSLQIDAPGDVARYRTWNFVRQDFAHPEPDAMRAPLLAGADLGPAVAKQVEIGLADRGFRRTSIDPDVLVHFQLAVREQFIEQNVTGAVQYLPSLHDAPSYDVQTTRTEVARYEVADLLVVMIDRKERRLVWRGRLNERYRGDFAPHLGEAVTQLLAQLPASELEQEQELELEPRPSANGRTVIANDRTRFPSP